MPSIFLLLAGCVVLDGSLEDSGEVGCSGQAVISASVTVLDPEGAFVSDALVVWRVGNDGGDCELWGELFEDQSYACGFEVPGSMTITVEHADFITAEATAEVEEDICHVQTELVEIVLEAAAD